MALGDKIVIPAMAAGFVSLLGKISTGVGDTLNLPEGMVNIGGNGKGYLLNPQTNYDPLGAGNNDGSFASLALGDDLYIYAVPDPGSSNARPICSVNATIPTGYTAANSRKLGGGHVGRYRGVANRYDTVYVPVSQILPNSCWDLAHRPTCDPSGMVEFVAGRTWVTIYHLSIGSGVWPELVPVSMYGATPIRDDVYSRSDFHQILAMGGYRAPTVEECLVYSEGAPGGLDASNDQAWSATTNTGPTTTGGVAKAVSQYNVVDAVGNLWDWTDNHNDLGDVNGSVTPFVQDSTVVDVGQDAATPRGSVNHAVWRVFVGGGSWSSGVYCGARCLDSHVYPFGAGGTVGLRGVCDSL